MRGNHQAVCPCASRRGALVRRLLPLVVLRSRRNVSLVLLVIALGAAGLRPSSERPDSSQAGTFAFVNANVVPMTSEVVLPSHTVVIRGDRISEVASSHTVRLPADVRTIDASGKYLIPGLVDFHVHLRAPGELDSYRDMASPPSSPCAAPRWFSGCGNGSEQKLSSDRAFVRQARSSTASRRSGAVMRPGS